MNNKTLRPVFVLLSALALAACGRAPLKIDIPARAALAPCPATAPVVPADPGQPGPWQVGARTVEVPNARWGSLKTEIFYPAQPGSTQGLVTKTWDLRQFLPAGDAAKIPDVANTLQTCDCYDNVPVDTSAGPYPVVVFIHGTASFRTQSAVQARHWASRGFVVVTADHPKIQLRDLKANPLGSIRATQSQDAVDLIAALQAPAGSLAFLAGVVDMDRVAVSGHSAGGMATAPMAQVPGVHVLMPMAGQGTKAGPYLQSSLVMGAVDDKVARYSGQKNGYANSPAPRRFVGVGNAGHMAFTEICALLSDQGGIIQVAENYGVSVPSILKTLGRDGCGATQTSPQAGWDLINYATTAVLEETLQCRPERAADLNAIPARFAIARDVAQTL
jgi:predicted dienelactone hydrolase